MSQTRYTRGRQYLRPISGDGFNFGLPEMLGGQILSVVPWSRLLDDKEVLLAINTDMDVPRQAWVTIDASLHQPNGKLMCKYSTDPTQIGTEVDRGWARRAPIGFCRCGF